MSDTTSSSDRLEYTAGSADDAAISDRDIPSHKNAPVAAKSQEANAAPSSSDPVAEHVEQHEDEDLLDESLPVPVGEEARAVLEALLFSATSPLSERRLSSLMNGIEIEALRELIDRLREDYDKEGRGITLMEVAGGYQLATRQGFAEWVFRLHKHRKRSALTPAVLETLAIVAYKQPIVRADIEAIRGVDCGGILRQLQDTGLVEVVGRKEVAGRPPLYGTTDLFLKSFGLKRLSDLPAIEELHTILAEAAGEEPAAEAQPPKTPAGDIDRAERGVQSELDFGTDSDAEDVGDEEEEYEEDEEGEDEVEDASEEDEEEYDEEDEDEDEEWEEDDEDRSS